MLKPDDIYKKVEDKWVSRVIMDEVVIMPLCRSEEDLQYIYSISNDTGTRLWQLLDGEHSVKDIQQILKREYQGQAGMIEEDVLEFVGDLIEVKLIEKVLATVKKVNLHPASCILHPDKKKNYKSPEIAKVKMQPEQAVLSCCTLIWDSKTSSPEWNVCATSCSCAYCTGGGGLEADQWSAGVS